MIKITNTQRHAAAILAGIGLVGAAALSAFDCLQLIGHAPMGSLAVLLVHLFFGWIPVLAGLLALSVRRSWLTGTVLVLAGLAFVAPLLSSLLL